MAYPQGIDFRATAGYVTDPANYAYDISGGNSYPTTTAQGNNVGWETSGMETRDRNAGNDARNAGMNFHNSTNADFRMDLSGTGNFNIGLAAGDPSYACPVTVDLYDTSSSLGSLATGSTSGSQKFKDATNTEYTNVTWPGSQTLVSKTFSTTICRFRLLYNASLSRICSVYAEAGAASGGGPLTNNGDLVRGSLIRGGRVSA